MDMDRNARLTPLGRERLAGMIESGASFASAGRSVAVLPGRPRNGGGGSGGRAAPVCVTAVHGRVLCAIRRPRLSARGSSPAPCAADLHPGSPGREDRQRGGASEGGCCLVCRHGVRVERVMRTTDHATNPAPSRPAAPHPHPTLHAKDQRQGGKVHPDRPARMGRRTDLPDLGPTRSRPADLDTPLQLAPPAFRVKVKNTHRPAGAAAEQPVEVPQLGPSGFPVFRFSGFPVFRFSGFPVFRFSGFPVFRFSGESRNPDRKPCQVQKGRNPTTHSAAFVQSLLACAYI